MSNETNINTVPGTEDNTDDTARDYQQYIDTINDLKRNTVSRDKYQQLEQENRQLLNTLASGGTIDITQTAPEKTEAELRKELYHSGPLSNLEYVKRSLALREKHLEETGEDDYVVPGRIDHARAQQIADIYQECVDASNGNPVLFTQELSSRMYETPAPVVSNNKSKRR